SQVAATEVYCCSSRGQQSKLVANWRQVEARGRAPANTQVLRIWPPSFEECISHVGKSTAARSQTRERGGQLAAPYCNRCSRFPARSRTRRSGCVGPRHGGSWPADGSTRNARSRRPWPQG